MLKFALYLCLSLEYVMKKFSHTPGFTIVELLIVIVVIGILAALVLVTVTGAKDKAEYARMRADFSNMRKLIETFKANEGRYPDSSLCVNANGETNYQFGWCGWDQGQANSFIPELVPAYTRALPTLDRTRQDNDTYLYQSRANGGGNGTDQYPQVLTTLLQMLDEGVLRDINNREVSFRDAIVIATSNAGADMIRTMIAEGRQVEECEAEIVNTLIDSQQFRPEFLNRFDEIVVFRPLTQEELVQVVSLIIDGINKTLSHQKIAIHVSDTAKQKLAAIGYDPRLGARPMRRVVQRSVESLVAKRMLEGRANAGDTIEITDEDIKT